VKQPGSGARELRPPVLTRTIRPGAPDGVGVVDPFASMADTERGPSAG
jgi:hypothetical protein